jgi:acyl-coenzyme A thioesterase PaaI-like protein
VSAVPKQWLVERIRAAAAEKAAMLPVHATFGVRALGAEPGSTQYGQRMGPWLLDREGLLCPGAFMIAADAALGSAVNTALTDGLTVMSLTIHAQFITLDPGAADDFTVRAETQHMGATSGFSAGEIVDDGGRLIARLSTQCGFLPLAGPPAIPRVPVRIADEDWTAPTSTTGLAAVAERRVGARLVDSREGQVTISAESGPTVRNSRGVLQGGVLGLLAEQAISACLVRSSPALIRAETMELDVSYLRGVAADQPGDPPALQIAARAEHAGRRFALARATCRDAAGQLVMSAVGSRYAGATERT